MNVTASTWVRVVDAGGHAVGDAVGDRPGLAGAGAGQHPDRSAQRQRDLALLRVEPVEEPVGAVPAERGSDPDDIDIGNRLLMRAG